MTTNVKYFHSSMTGAPVLSGQAGKLIDVLDACLINGFGSGTVDSVVIAGGIATVTRAAGHSFEADTVALIAGATVTGGSINGEQRVLSVTSTTYTFATAVGNQTATGTITHKVAPLDFTKVYSGTNLAAYKSSNVVSTGCLLRLDDTGTTVGRPISYHTMSDINTGTLAFPGTALYWTKSITADATARLWLLIGDDRGFYLHVFYNGGNGATVTFGDFKSYKPADPYACSLLGQTGAMTGNPAGNELFFMVASGATHYAPRGFSGTGGAQFLVRTAHIPMAISYDNIGSGVATNGYMNYPNPVDDGMYLSPYLITERTVAYALRGSLPGAYFAPINVLGVFAAREKVVGVSALPGRKLMAMNTGSQTGFIDITGPWDR